MIERISYSALRDYLSCPLLYWYRHVSHFKLPFRPLPLVFGNALHKALEEMEKNSADPVLVFSKVFKQDEIDFIDFKSKQPLSKKDADAKYKEELANGIRLLEFYREFRSTLNFEIIKTEEKFKIPLLHPITGKQSEVVKYMTGIGDFETRCSTLGDYKTSSKKYTQDQVDESDQPTFYYFWKNQIEGKLPKSFTYIVFRKKIKKEPVQVLSTTRSIDDLVDLYNKIESAGKKIKARKFARCNHEKYDLCDCYTYDKFLHL